MKCSALHPQEQKAMQVVTAKDVFYLEDSETIYHQWDQDLGVMMATRDWGVGIQSPRSNIWNYWDNAVGPALLRVSNNCELEFKHKVRYLYMCITTYVDAITETQSYSRVL